MNERQALKSLTSDSNIVIRYADKVVVLDSNVYN